jgi:hypothetical protein
MVRGSVHYGNSFYSEWDFQDGSLEQIGNEWE